MKVYLASGFHQASTLRILAQRLKRDGYDVCSSWIYLESRPDRETEEWNMFAPKIAGSNLIDLLQAEIMVIDQNGIRQDGNGGAHTELGFAIARDLPIFLVGKRTNTFHWLPSVTLVKDYEELLEYL